MTLLEALRQTLVDQNVQSVYLLSVPPEICPAVVLRSYASRSEIDIPIGRQSIQCFIRATSFPESEQIAWECFKIFADLHHSNLADRFIYSVILHQEPFYLEKDERNQYLHIFNFDVLCRHKEV